jgi:predicted 2-oxoglutarate/Fe(II)-dependent dioxygenase YbiX
MANGEFNHRLSDYIVVIRGIISKEMCQQVIDLYKDNEKWEWGGFASGMDMEQRKVKQLQISHSETINSNEKFIAMDKEIFSVMSKAQDTYRKTLLEKRGMQHRPRVSSDVGYQMLHYSEGYYIKEHCDDYGGLARVLTCSLNLSDDHDGGLFRFFRGEFDVSLKAGDAIVFPANFMFPHEVTEITRGERYSIVTWFL